MKIARLTASDRASAGIYQDISGPEVERLLTLTLGAGHQFQSVVVPDDLDTIAAKLRHFADTEGCALIVTTGGTGIGPRDITPEATRAVVEKEIPGFGEVMRQRSFDKVPTSILSRATAGVRGRSLIVNLPGKPTAVAECLEILGPALRECLSHLRGDDPHTSPPANI
jgi:molybdopterin adenylyltransferase